MTAHVRIDTPTRVPSRPGASSRDAARHRAKVRRIGALGIGAGLLAAAAGATALVVRDLTRKAERRDPPTGRFVTIDGVDVHYEDHGEGPPVVLIHGNGTFVPDWSLSGVTERLVGEGHRVIILDRPGYGYTTRPRDRL